MRESKRVEISNLSGTTGIIKVSAGDEFMGLTVSYASKFQCYIGGEWVDHSIVVDFQGDIAPIMGTVDYQMSTMMGSGGIFWVDEPFYDKIPAMVLADNSTIRADAFPVPNQPFIAQFGELAEDESRIIEDVEIGIRNFSMAYRLASEGGVNATLVEVNGMLIK